MKFEEVHQRAGSASIFTCEELKLIKVMMKNKMEKFVCNCGEIVSESERKNHRKSQEHKYNMKRKQIEQEIICICGEKIRYYTRKNHEKSLKHCNNLLVSSNQTNR